NEIKKAEKMGLINYEVYEIVSAILPNAGGGFNVTLDEIRSLKGIEPIAADELEHWGAALDRNVIVIQMESMQDFVIGLEAGGKEVTPVLNELARSSYYFPNVYQQNGQGNTSDTEYLVNTSLYIPPNGAASQEYGSKDLPSFPKVLKTYGYESMTFHTNDLEFW